MQFYNYKQLLREISKSKDVVVTLSIWTYRSKRMVFKAYLKNIDPHFDKDMFYNNKHNNFTFKSVNGKMFKAHRSDLKIVKVDCVEFFKPNNEEITK